MNKRNLIVLCVVIIFIIASFVIPHNELSKETHNFSFLSLLPPILAILLAFLTKQVLLSLFLGIFAGVLMLNGGNPFFAFLRTLDEFILGSAADSWNAAILIFTLTIGGMVGIVGKMGGTRAIAEGLAKRAKTARGAQIATWLLGVVVFFDDYANTLIVGPTMRPLTDKLNVSREKLSYIVDSTAAPVVGMALVSTWIGYEIGLIKDAYALIGIETNVYSVFIRTIPYRLYSIFALILVLVLALRLRDFGPMYKAEKRARLTGKVLGDDAKPMASDELTKMELKEGTKPKARNAIIPIVVLVAVSFLGLWYNGYSGLIADGEAVKAFSWAGIRDSFGYSDASVVLIWGAVTASLVAIVMAVTQKILTIGEAFESWVDGAKSLLITCIILILAWSLGSVTGAVGTADFLVEAVSGSLPGGLLPIIVFLISCLVAFATGTSWGTMAIVMPLAIPLANSYVMQGAADPVTAPLILATLGSVLTGSIFGDHCSPISDTTIMSSMASASDHIDHVKTQAPYALVGAGLAVLGYLLIGLFGLNPLWAILIGFVVLYAVVQIFGKSTKLEDLTKEMEKEGAVE